MIAKIATMAGDARRPVRPLPCAIWPSDLPSRRIDAHRITKSCTAPPSTTPTMSQIVPGQEAELRGQRRPDERSGAGDGREVVAEQRPTGWSGTKSRPLLRRSAGVARLSIEAEDLRAR